MADDVTITKGASSTPPDGTVIATDEVGSVHYQKIKIALGADGAVDTLVDSGQQTMADSIPVALASNQSTLPTEQQETAPTDASRNNPSCVLTYTAGDLTKITATIGGTSYEKTLTYTNGDLTGISAWSAV
jgi:hypothetical protein